MNKSYSLNNRQIDYQVSFSQKITIVTRIQKFFTNDILYWFIFFFAITPMVFPYEDQLIVGAFVYTLIIFIMKKKRFNRVLIFLSILWVIINVAAFYRSISFNITTFPYAFYMQFIRLFLAYMIMSLLGNEFFYTLDKWLYKLSILSLPLFILEIIYRPLFFRIAPYLNFATGEEQRLAGGWYGGFYTFNAWAAGRNSGFMWEPGGFAFILIFLIIFRFYQNSFKFDKHIIVYFICLATTLSTAGILVGFILLLTYLISKSKYGLPILIIPLSIYIFISYIWGLEFMGPKIMSYINSITRTWEWSFGSEYTLRLNRMGIFYHALQQSFKYPLGHGVFPVLGFIEEFGENVSGPNTYARLLVKWGWIGFILFITGIFNTAKKMFRNYNNIIQILIAMSIILILFSNTLDNNLIVLGFLLYPFADINNVNKSTINI